MEQTRVGKQLISVGDKVRYSGKTGVIVNITSRKELEKKHPGMVFYADKVTIKFDGYSIETSFCDRTITVIENRAA